MRKLIEKWLRPKPKRKYVPVLSVKCLLTKNKTPYMIIDIIDENGERFEFISSSFTVLGHFEKLTGVKTLKRMYDYESSQK